MKAEGATPKNWERASAETLTLTSLIVAEAGRKPAGQCGTAGSLCQKPLTRSQVNYAITVHGCLDPGQSTPPRFPDFGPYPACHTAANRRDGMIATDTLRPRGIAPAVPTRLLSTDEAARHCGVSAAYLRYVVNTHRLPCVRVGLAYGFHPHDLDEWNDARKAKRAARLIRHARNAQGGTE